MKNQDQQFLQSIINGEQFEAMNAPDFAETLARPPTSLSTVVPR